jgi:outer membrane immunogenic protein
MKIAHVLLLGAAVATVSSAARAADLIVDEPAVIAAASSVDWSGFYVGAHVGYGAGTMHLESPGLIDPDDENQSVDGFLGGVQLGYNIQADTIVFGVQTELGLSGIASDEDGGGADDTVDWLGSTTARIGLALDGVLPYVKAGVAYGGGTGDAAGVQVSNTHIGWTAGAGVEIAVADSISVFGEYAYTDLGTETYSFGAPVNADVDVSMQFHTVKAGLNFGF